VYKQGFVVEHGLVGHGLGCIWVGNNAVVTNRDPLFGIGVMDLMKVLMIVGTDVGVCALVDW